MLEENYDWEAGVGDDDEEEKEVLVDDRVNYLIEHLAQFDYIEDK